MQAQNFDITQGDLNPTFLFSCIFKTREDETNYHSHDFIELVVILKGRRVFYIDGNYYTVKEGDMLFLNPGTYHMSLVDRSVQTLSKECYIGFSNVQFRNCMPEWMPLPDGNIVYSMSDGIRQDVFKICSSMEREANNCKIGRYFMLKAYLLQLLCILQREQAELTEEQNGYVFKSVHKKYVVRQIKKYMEEHYQEKISLDTIAKNMYLSTFYISKIFKSETGDTPINFLIQLRMEKARELLEDESAKSIQDVAACVGYEDAYHFSKLFKKYYGVAPSRYS